MPNKEQNQQQIPSIGPNDGLDRSPWWVDYKNLEISGPPSNITNRLDLNLNNAKARGGAIVQRLVTFTNTDATPTVKNANVFITTGTTAITNFDDGKIGQTIKIVATGNITITYDASKINLAGATNYAMTATDTLVLCMFTTGLWSELSRTVI